MRTGMILTLMLVLFAGIAMADRATFDETKTRIAMPLPEPPTIDGYIDITGEESWVYAGGVQPNGSPYWTIEYDDFKEDWTRGGNVASGEGPLSPEDFKAEFYVGYDSDYLYVAVRVIDDEYFSDSAEAGSQNGQTWHDDSVEVFVDGDNSNHPDRDTAGDKPEGWSTGGQYVVTINNAYREAEAGDPGYGPEAAWYGLSDIDDNGNYNFEFRISMDLIGNPQPGDIIGFDIAINDDDDGDTLENQYTWAGATHEEITYGNLLLGPRSYTAPKASAPAIDGVINAAEYAGAEEIVITHHTGVYNGDDDWVLGDHDYSAWVIHDDEAIYVAVSVTDDILMTDSAEAGSEDGQTWVDDSAEIFFDADASGDRGRGAGEFEGQYVFTPNGAWRDNEANNPTFGADADWFAASQETSTGYEIEFKITKAALFDPSDGSTIGFDIAVNDDDEGPRKTQLAWNGRPHNEASYGNLTLGAGGTHVADWSLY